MVVEEGHTRIVVENPGEDSISRHEPHYIGIQFGDLEKPLIPFSLGDVILLFYVCSMREDESLSQLV